MTHVLSINPFHRINASYLAISQIEKSGQSPFFRYKEHFFLSRLCDRKMGEAPNLWIGSTHELYWPAKYQPQILSISGDRWDWDFCNLKWNSFKVKFQTSISPISWNRLIFCRSVELMSTNPQIWSLIPKWLKNFFSYIEKMANHPTFRSEK